MGSTALRGMAGGVICVLSTCINVVHAKAMFFPIQKHRDDSESTGLNNVDDIPVTEIDLSVPLHVPGTAAYSELSILYTLSVLVSVLYYVLVSLLTLRLFNTYGW